MNEVMRSMAMLILHKAEECKTCIQADLNQGFQKCLFYQELLIPAYISTGSKEIWMNLNIAVLRAEAVETGDHRENPPINSIVRHDSHMRKSGVTRPGIEPGSPWREASRLTATPPRPPSTCRLTGKRPASRRSFTVMQGAMAEAIRVLITGWQEEFRARRASSRLTRRPRRGECHEESRVDASRGLHDNSTTRRGPSRSTPDSRDCASMNSGIRCLPVKFCGTFAPCFSFAKPTPSHLPPPPSATIRCATTTPLERSRLTLWRGCAELPTRGGKGLAATKLLGSDFHKETRQLQRESSITLRRLLALHTIQPPPPLHKTTKFNNSTVSAASQAKPRHLSATALRVIPRVHLQVGTETFRDFDDLYSGLRRPIACSPRKNPMITKSGDTALDCQSIKEYVTLSEDCEVSRVVGEWGGGGECVVHHHFGFVSLRLINSAFVIGSVFVLVMSDKLRPNVKRSRKVRMFKDGLVLKIREIFHTVPLGAKQYFTCRSQLNFTVLYKLEPASFPNWLLHRCEGTPFLTGLHVIGQHNRKVFVYWRTVTQGVSHKVAANDLPVTDLQTVLLFQVFGDVTLLRQQFLRHQLYRNNTSATPNEEEHIIGALANRHNIGFQPDCNGRCAAQQPTGRWEVGRQRHAQAIDWTQATHLQITCTTLACWLPVQLAANEKKPDVVILRPNSYNSAEFRCKEAYRPFTVNCSPFSFYGGDPPLGVRGLGAVLVKVASEMMLHRGCWQVSAARNESNMGRRHKKKKSLQFDPCTTLLFLLLLIRLSSGLFEGHFRNERRQKRAPVEVRVKKKKKATKGIKIKKKRKREVKRIGCCLGEGGSTTCVSSVGDHEMGWVYAEEAVKFPWESCVKVLRLLAHTVFNTFWRTLAQSSPSTVTADNQRAINIDTFVHKIVDALLGVEARNLTGPPLTHKRRRVAYLFSKHEAPTKLRRKQASGGNGPSAPSPSHSPIETLAHDAGGGGGAGIRPQQGGRN
ncbi:hypothetical protein PR048_007801 [Dryococelus australis]|uniref:Uncharacterized protein n=1 Tax=Dryococelus australis TaxID=614101 RepID=A0ABQ9HVA5_9NEOP|nr:hypothetical protein PR048_007801 [Dryococelus australis]